MKTEEIIGSVENALTWLICELNKRGDYQLLSKWDEIRGNDWIVSTRLSEQKKNNE